MTKLNITREQAHSLIEAATKDKDVIVLTHEVVDTACESKLPVYISILEKKWSICAAPGLTLCRLYSGKAKQWVSKNITFEVHTSTTGTWE